MASAAAPIMPPMKPSRATDNIVVSPAPELLLAISTILDLLILERGERRGVLT